MKDPAPNDILDQRYRLVRSLGRGGFGSVWYAEHLALHSPVAIKLLDPVAVEEADVLQRFLREARAAAALRSPHVVQILDYGVEDGVPFIVMEMLEGESLERRLKRVKSLSPYDTERVIRHVARAVTRAHEAGVIHRDLKPANIFIVPNDDEEVIKVLDFGIAKTNNLALGRSLEMGPTPAGALLGTPHYMSPEQAQGMPNLDHRTDYWSIGVIAYECLLGKPPFDGGSLSALLVAICNRLPPVPSQHGSVPPNFDDWFARACARRPNDRFESARQMAQELTRLCELPPAVPAPTLRLSRLELQRASAEAESQGPSQLPVSSRSRQTYAAAAPGALLPALLGNVYLRIALLLVSGIAMLLFGRGIFAAARTKPEPRLEPTTATEALRPGGGALPASPAPVTPTPEPRVEPVIPPVEAPPLDVGSQPAADAR